MNNEKIIIICLIIYIYFKESAHKFKSHLKNVFSNEYICMCSIAKEENLYIKEFIEHYKALGYNHFYIYDNNDENGERFEEVLREEINEGLVTIINFRNFRGIHGGPQMDAYYRCYINNKNNCTWISFFDIDEFLMLESNNISLKQLLNDPRYSKCEGISINWKIIHDNDLLEYKNISIKARFKGIKNNFRANFSKLIARGSLPYNLTKSYSAHTLWYDIKLCNTLGKRITYRFWLTPHSYRYMYLNHYYTKSIVEYCYKLKKGNVFYNFTLNQNLLREKFNNFFLINNKTQEKVDIYNKFFNTTFK